MKRDQTYSVWPEKGLEPKLVGGSFTEMDLVINAGAQIIIVTDNPSWFSV